MNKLTNEVASELTNKPVYCTVCRSRDSFHRDANRDIKGVYGRVIEYRFVCPCGHNVLVNANKNL